MPNQKTSEYLKRDRSLDIFEKLLSARQKPGEWVEHICKAHQYLEIII